MNAKRNVRKASQRRRRFLVGLALGLALCSAVVAFVRLSRGNNDSPDVSSLPDAPASWRILPDPETTVESATSPEAPAGHEDPAKVSSEFVDEFTFLAQSDPRAAAARLARLSEGEERDVNLAVLIDAWTDSDPGAAAAWVATLPAGSFLEDATGQLMLRWGEANPKAAADWVDENLASGREPSGASTFASAWTRSDPEAAIAWADGIENPAARKEACGAVAYQLGLDHPPRAAAWIATVDDPSLQNALATGLISTWAGKDPAAAAAWLDGGGLAHADDNVRRKAALMLVSQWTLDDPRPASIWINALGEGPLKEDSKVALAQTLAAEAPADALIWADAIVAVTERQEVSLSIYEDWVENDPADFKQQLIQRWSGIADPAMRRGIYALLYAYDPAFKDEVVQLIDKAISE